MTSMLDTLERRGLVRRMPHPDDRRKLLVDVTDEAVAILDEMLPSLHQRERAVIDAALTKEEQAACSSSWPRSSAADDVGRRPDPTTRLAGVVRPARTRALTHRWHGEKAPPAGLEPAHPAPEAGALSAELRGQTSAIRAMGGPAGRCTVPAAL